ncbi:MAG: enoyl-CoA hydratase/isomerase family protein [Gemmatimonadota bacterium]|nr:MAG: enoyl-CoA hydratase/isomerase family protein [Gemmatimonadota bacterium]
MTTETTLKDGVGEVVLNNPPLNILTRDVMRELREALANLRDEGSLRVLILKAAGKHFSAGADVAEHLPPHYEAMIPEFIETIGAVDSFPLPVIAAVRGRCLGGGFELIQPADFVIASDQALLGQPEIMLGVLPPAACAILPQLCPPSVAAEIVLTGDTIDAQQALQHGLVWKVVADSEVEATAAELAHRLARHSGAALRNAKRALREVTAPARAHALHRAGRIYIDDLMQTRDAVEGLTAFTEKREAQWQHQ